ncbi:aminotransferase class I/II-fold pyridoxal phosphate-dependent enzyme [Sporosarcina sp. G11-34]|uniref:aminotransferase class I/II-fold pyridoxal phosphate-dependent enzyme n=1 Tax=Sporosarcina sp. G11-34 TaxID=2849605 RepID=UPI0022A9B4C0|nr:aminotransferase class I/II-fold pyridoxal phosphate-dependent enzyme [Sporosarcina sp. G11-34]MCZ2257565.1 aminotransferase class I/II-fold pyridoxal phosphate-dependent enzyme [Sporosarcina sp. G11-34]
MALSINPRVENIELSGIRKISNLLVNYPDAMNLTVGQPDFPTPALVKKAGLQAIMDNKTGYTHNAGLLELRQAASAFFTKKYGFAYDSKTEVIITAGASGGMDAVFRTILKEGDEIIVPAPIFAGYVPLITLTGAKIVYLDTTDTGFIPDPKRLEKLITPKTKAVVFSYPSNPTGVILPHDTMDELVAVLARHEVFVVSDEIYSENTFEGKHRSFGEYAELRNKLFLIHGLSKSHAMTGWRVGFLFGAAEWMKHTIKLHAHNTICVNAPAQHAAICALTECADAPAEMNKEYIVRRDFVYGRLTAMGLPTVKPNGAFYIFPSIKEFNKTSEQFALELLDKAGVAVVPGTAFTPLGEGYVRISYAYAYDQLEIAMDRLEKWVTDWRNNERHIVPNAPLI